MTGKFYNLVTNSRVVKNLYNGKFYFDLGAAQISWLTSKIPELAGVVILADAFGFPLPAGSIPPLVSGVFITLILLGVFMKRTGLYDAEIYINADKNPVVKEMLVAARKINGEKENDA